VYTRLTISVYYTKAIVGEMHFTGLHPGLSLAPGRPRLIGAIEGTIAHTLSIGGSSVHSGLIVGVCGPVSLGDDVSKAVGLVDPAKRDDIGGIEIHEEFAPLFSASQMAHYPFLGHSAGRLSARTRFRQFV
jgi:hypothetical protein